MPSITSPEKTDQPGPTVSSRLNPLFCLAALILLLALGDAALNLYTLFYRPSPDGALSQQATAPAAVESKKSIEIPNTHQENASRPAGQPTNQAPPGLKADADHPPAAAAPEEGVNKTDTTAEHRGAPTGIEADQDPGNPSSGGTGQTNIDPQPAPPAPVEPSPEPSPPPSTDPAPGTTGGSLAGLPDLTSRLHKGEYQEAARHFQEALQTTAARFTVSLEVACQPDTLSRAFSHADYHPALYVLPRKLGDRNCFVLLWGLYDTAPAAQRGMDLLPAYFHQQSPPPRVVLLSTYLQ